MANVPEVIQYDAGVYQLETADPVLGGVGGIANAQAKALANRTAYLKQQVELRAPLNSPALTGTPTAPTASNVASSQVANMTAVMNAIAALVNSSPAALDTLNELATALGNDPNFAATITTALGLKAPLANPAFSGNPTAPTPAQFDNDTSLATTAFVRAAMGSHSGFFSTTASRNILASEAGFLFAMSGTTGHNLTLPSAASVPAGTCFSFHNVCTQGCGVYAQAGQSITAGAAIVGGSGGLVLSVGDTATVWSNGAAWYAFGGSFPMKYAPSFGASILSTGYQKLPSGLIIQWGLATPSVAGVTVGFPIAFPTATLAVLMTKGTRTNSWVSTEAYSTNGFAIYSQADEGAGHPWIAIGS